MDNEDDCPQCVYEAAERCSTPKTALACSIQANRKKDLEISYWKTCECLSCDPHRSARKILINSDDCLCKKSKEASFRSCIHGLCGQPYWNCKTQSWRARSRSPPPPTPGMKLIQGQSQQSQVPEKHVGRAAEADQAAINYTSEPQKQKRGQPVAPALRRHENTPLGVVSSWTKCPAQLDWKSVSALLTPEVLLLDRTIPEVRWALEDPNTIIRLPEHSNIAQHCKNVIEALPRHWRFKVGVTAFLKKRFYEAKYAYSMPSEHKKDGVVYEFFILVLVDHARKSITITEHFLIHLFKVDSTAKDRCANRLIIHDDHWKADSDEEKPEAAGPHWVYFACGPPCRVCPR